MVHPDVKYIIIIIIIDDNNDKTDDKIKDGVNEIIVNKNYKRINFGDKN